MLVSSRFVDHLESPIGSQKGWFLALSTVEGSSVSNRPHRNLASCDSGTGANQPGCKDWVQ